MKYNLTLLLFAALLFTGCLDANNNNDCVPVDQSAILAEYADREDYIETESGLIYKVVEEGNGEIPQENQFVFVEFKGKLVSDDVFEETDGLIFFLLNDGLIPGLREGLSLMSEGSTFELVMPPELAFGNNPPRGTIIQCGAVVIYEITLDSFLRDVDTFLEQNAAREDVEIKVTDSGLQYHVIEEGEGESPVSTDDVRVRYKGSLTNGVVFDQTDGDDTAEFRVDGVIDGFTEGLLLMNEGSKFELFIPPNLAYGNNPPRDPRGEIVFPPNSILVFEVELVEILEE
tara:strand:+ start:11640 stop:12500 length:861 start_codon:yes stop_codon:yes gene_type:complete